jgi:hypothetical protein
VGRHVARSPNVPTGVYLVEVVATGWAFDTVRREMGGGLCIGMGADRNLPQQVRLEFVARDKANTRASLHVVGMQPAGELAAVPYPLQLEARARLDFFTKRAGFSLWGVVSNPMLLMTAVVLLMGYGLPKLTEGLGTAARPTHTHTSTHACTLMALLDGRMPTARTEAELEAQGQREDGDGAAAGGAAAGGAVAAGGAKRADRKG